MRVEIEECLGLPPARRLVRYVDQDGKPITESDWQNGRWEDITPMQEGGVLRRFIRSIGDR